MIVKYSYTYYTFKIVLEKYLFMWNYYSRVLKLIIIMQQMLSLIFSGDFRRVITIFDLLRKFRGILAATHFCDEIMF